MGEGTFLERCEEFREDRMDLEAGRVKRLLLLDEIIPKLYS